MQGRRRTAVAGAALVAGLALTGGPALAEVRQLEAVGAVPLRTGSRPQAPRDEAVRLGIREAVWRVAEELLLESEEGEEPRPALEDVLGTRMVPYTASYRVLEDRGERRALFAEDPDVTSEYVVIVEVEVDVDRVEERLVAAGLVLPRSAGQLIGRVRVELDGVDAYGAYEAVRGLLDDGSGAVIPLEFEPGRAALLVETPLTASDLLDRILAEAPPGLEVVPLRAGGGALTLSVNWSPPPVAAADRTAGGD